jgi:hypothetical protein
MYANSLTLTVTWLVRKIGQLFASRDAIIDTRPTLQYLFRHNLDIVLFCKKCEKQQ